MPDKLAKQRWTRTEKWLIAAPLLVLLCLFGMTTGKEIVRRRMGWPARVIPIAGKDFLRLFALSPNGEFTIGQGETTTLKFYDAISGDMKKELQLLPPAPGQVQLQATPQELGFSSENHRLALGFVYKPVEIWDTETSTLITRLPTTSFSLSLSPDACYLANDWGEVWNLQTKRLVFRTRYRNNNAPVFSADSTLVAMSYYKVHVKRGDPVFFYDGHICIYEVSSGKLKRKFPTVQPKLNIDQMAFSHDAKTIACFIKQLGTGNENLALYEVATGRVIWKKPWRGHDNDMIFSPDGRWIAISLVNDSIQLVEARTGKLITTLHSKWPDAKVTGYMKGPAVRFTGDGKLLVLRGARDVFIWNMDEVNAQFAP